MFTRKLLFSSSILYNGNLLERSRSPDYFIYSFLRGSCLPEYLGCWAPYYVTVICGRDPVYQNRFCAWAPYYVIVIWNERKYYIIYSVQTSTYTKLLQRPAWMDAQEKRTEKCINHAHMRQNLHAYIYILNINILLSFGNSYNSDALRFHIRIYLVALKLYILIFLDAHFSRRPRTGKICYGSWMFKNFRGTRKNDLYAVYSNGALVK
jgi:hypothetical protein